jgi:hypothetical protein
MNFSSPHAFMQSDTVPSLIQETKVLARSPAGFFLPVIFRPGKKIFRFSASRRYSSVKRFCWLLTTTIFQPTDDKQRNVPGGI